jgi:hypothetical protein
MTCRDRSVKFYFDGEPVGEQTLAHRLAAKDADLVIGRGMDPDSKGKAAPAGFDGRLDELLIFHRVLAADEIRLIAQAGKELGAAVNRANEMALGGH